MQFTSNTSILQKQICIEPSKFPAGPIPTTITVLYNGRFPYNYKFTNTDSNGNHCYVLLNSLAGIGSRKKKKPSPTPPPVGCTDTDALAFFAAVVANGGSLTTLEKSVICQYVKDLKAAGIWTAELADYPMVGSTANSCAINLKNPGTFDLTFVNTIAGDFTSNGWKPNGVNSYARTGFIPSTDLAVGTDIGLEYYSRTDSSGNFLELGAFDGAHYPTLAINALFDTRRHVFAYDATFNLNIVAPIGDSMGDFLGTTKDNGDGAGTLTMYRAGSSIGTTTVPIGTLSTIELFLGAINLSPSGVFFPTDRQCAGAAILNSTNIDPTKALAFYTARQAMNTTLGRQV